MARVSPRALLAGQLLPQTTFDILTDSREFREIDGTKVESWMHYTYSERNVSSGHSCQYMSYNTRKETPFSLAWFHLILQKHMIQFSLNILNHMEKWRWYIPEV